MKWILLCVPLLAAACGTAKPEPVDITSDDMCERCRMAISERRCAGEFIDNEGTAHKFDDLACMQSYLKGRNSGGPAPVCFVVDYETRRWIPAGDATYVRSPEFKTPMAGGIVAFRDRSSAENAAARFQGAILSYREVFW